MRREKKESGKSDRDRYKKTYISKERCREKLRLKQKEREGQKRRKRIEDILNLSDGTASKLDS